MLVVSLLNAALICWDITLKNEVAFSVVFFSSNFFYPTKSEDVMPPLKSLLMPNELH
jgi:hypothetical protein